MLVILNEWNDGLQWYNNFEQHVALWNFMKIRSLVSIWRCFCMSGRKLLDPTTYSVCALLLSYHVYAFDTCLYVARSSERLMSTGTQPYKIMMMTHSSMLLTFKGLWLHLCVCCRHVPGFLSHSATIHNNARCHPISPFSQCPHLAK